jgi:hypothetical protein
VSLRSLGAVAGLLILAIASSWGVARWRHARPELRGHAWTAILDAQGIPESLRVLETSRSYRGVLSDSILRGARPVSEREVEVELDPRENARLHAEGRAHPTLVGLLPSVARGRIVLLGEDRVSESWRLACPDGCALDLLDRDPPAGAPSAAWSVAPRRCRAVAWFALDTRRLADPTLGGEGLAPLRERVDAVERLIGRPLREELARGLVGTGIVAIEEREPPRGPRVLVALDLREADRVRALVDLFVALAIVGGRGEVLHHRDVAVGVVGAPGRGGALAIDGPLLLLSDEPGAVTGAIDRRRAAGSAPASPPPSFGRFRGSWRAERTAPPAVTATLTREGIWWWLRGEGASPAVTADPALPYVRSWLASSGRRVASR